MKKISKHGSRRRFSEEFKRARVLEYEKGLITVSEISHQYHVSITSVYKWLDKYSYFQRNNWIMVEKSESKTIELETAKKRIEDLERLLGKKQIEIDYLSKLLEVASEDLGLDIKKNINIQR